MWLFLCGGAAVIALAALGIYRLPGVFQADTALTQSPSVTHYVASGVTVTQHITKQFFALELPAGWQSVAPPNIPYTVYSWRGTGNDAARRLDVYIDTVPPGLAVNRLLAVQADGDHMVIMEAVSDNCASFTDKATESLATGTAPAKWGGVSFICDMGNYTRDVVAAGSAGTVNAVTLTGATTGTHKVLLLYEDNSSEPDYTIFDAMVQSFKVL